MHLLLLFSHLIIRRRLPFFYNYLLKVLFFNEDYFTRCTIQDFIYRYYLHLYRIQ